MLSVIQPCCSSHVVLSSNVIFNGQLLQAFSLNEQIDVQEESFNALFSKAQEMAHSISEGHPSIAKVPNSLDHLKWRFFCVNMQCKKNYVSALFSLCCQMIIIADSIGSHFLCRSSGPQNPCWRFLYSESKWVSQLKMWIICQTLINWYVNCYLTIASGDALFQFMCPSMWDLCTYRVPMCSGLCTCILDAIY